jgi:hypothetical protein
MVYRSQWHSLSSRIRGLIEAGELHARFLAVRSSDSYGRTGVLRQQCQEILESLQAFNTQFASVLPEPARAAIDAFTTARRDLITDTSGSPDSREERVWAALVMLGALETQLSHLLADTQEVLRSRADRAFEHLQRTIVVDPDEAKKWRAAFEAGETACEQLGAVRLLAHGIWAFKVNSEGERTDLVYPEPLDETNASRSAEGLVLTEWKKVGGTDNAARAFEQARAQGNLYAKGSLAGIELAAYRYAVVVSEKRIVVPADVTDRGVTYRHVNSRLHQRHHHEKPERQVEHPNNKASLLDFWVQLGLHPCPSARPGVASASRGGSPGLHGDVGEEDRGDGLRARGAEPNSY